jgi:hypothetical protein
MSDESCSYIPAGSSLGSRTKISTARSGSWWIWLHVGDHLAVHGRLDDGRELTFHRLLEAAPDLVDGVHVAVLDQGPLDGREPTSQDADHGVVDEIGLGLRRSLAVITAVEPHQAGVEMLASTSPRVELPPTGS